MARQPILVAILALVASGCHSAGPTSASGDGGFTDPPAATEPGGDAAASPHATKPAGRPAAYISSEALTWNDMQQPLAEAAGGTVLVEEVLDRGIARRLHDRNLTVDDDRIKAEQAQLLSDLSSDPNEAQRMINELRDRRGLGEQRYARLLRRNAGLRLLVQGEGEVTDQALKDAYDFRYGPRYQARLIVTGTMAAASEAIRRAKAGENFSDLAVELSTDSSKSQGGLLSPISPADAMYPASIRQALAQLQPGQVSDPVALDKGFGVLKLERKVEGSSVKFDDVKEDLAQRVRREVERIAMQRLARTILTESDVVILDPTLQKSFVQQKKRVMQENN